MIERRSIDRLAGSTAPSTVSSVPTPGHTDPALIPATLASTRSSWLTVEKALYICRAVVLTCVVWQPFLLGFYLDDWSVNVDVPQYGAAFSKVRFNAFYDVDPTRPGLTPLHYLFSSILGDHALLWQGALLLTNCLVAYSIVVVVRVLNKTPTALATAVAECAGWCWLLVPWNAAARFWPTMVPLLLVLAVEGFLWIHLLKGWINNQSRAISAGFIYLWMCLSYEVFYLQWAPLVLAPWSSLRHWQHFGTLQARDSGMHRGLYRRIGFFCSVKICPMYYQQSFKVCPK
jgi:hypothetical protein